MGTGKKLADSREKGIEGDGSIFFKPKIQKRKNNNNNRTVPFSQRNSR